MNLSSSACFSPGPVSATQAMKQRWLMLLILLEPQFSYLVSLVGSMNLSHSALPLLLRANEKGREMLKAQLITKESSQLLQQKELASLFISKCMPTHTSVLPHTHMHIYAMSCTHVF